MKKLILLCAVLWGFVVGGFAQETEKVDFVLFVSPTCVHCNKLKHEYWPELKKKYKDLVNFKEYDITVPGNNLIFADTLHAYGAEQLGFPAAVVGNSLLMGYPTQIGVYSEAAIEKARQEHETTHVVLSSQADTEAAVKADFQKITFWAIVGAGLVDGINPCAFAVIVFFISFLTVYKYSRREILLIGASYCVAVFVAYFLLGLGAFKFLYALRGFSYIIKGFYIVTALLCLVFFALAIYDFCVYTKTKKTDGMLLQLPQSLKIRIHKIMGFFLRDKQKSTFRLVLAALAVGFCVSIVEAVCTGQVYLPTCVLIMQDPEFRVRAAFYLVLYNLMFIVPLIAVFVLALAGYESKGFNDFLKKHLGFVKLLLCVVFLGLFLLLAMNI